MIKIEKAFDLTPILVGFAELAQVRGHQISVTGTHRERNRTNASQTFRVSRVSDGDSIMVNVFFQSDNQGGVLMGLSTSRSAKPYDPSQGIVYTGLDRKDLTVFELRDLLSEYFNI